VVPERDVLRTVFRKLEFSHGHNMLTGNGLIRVLDILPWATPYVGAGAGVSLPHTEIHLRGEADRTYEYQYTGWVGQALAGVEVRLQRVSIFVEYKFTYAPYVAPLSRRNSKLTLFEDLWLQFSDWWAGRAPPGGFASTQLTSHQVIGGLGVRFAPAR
jgi:opacity protein-like surface antigen